MHRARTFAVVTILALAGAVFAAPTPAAAEEVTKADAAKITTFMDKLADITVADQNNCDKMATDVSAHIDANKDLVNKANKATAGGAKLPKDSQDKVMASVNKMMPALQKCMQNPKVEAAFDKFNMLRRGGGGGGGK